MASTLTIWERLRFAGKHFSVDQVVHYLPHRGKARRSSPHLEGGPVLPGRSSLHLECGPVLPGRSSLHLEGGPVVPGRRAGEQNV